ncbi:MAG: type II secretion system protein [Firmicutes bacterium]|nr:type II secretion system protein [Candidatus Colivicinus equi]
MKTNRTKKQGYKYRFTFGEMLVVAAILALLMVVSGIGYTSFIKKASNSNALSECKQAQQIILSRLLSTDGKKDLTVNCDGLTFGYDLSKGKVVFSGTLETADGGETFTKKIKEEFDEVNKLDGSFNLVGKAIIYTTKDGKGQAIWNSGELPMSIKDYNENK